MKGFTRFNAALQSPHTSTKFIAARSPVSEPPGPSCAVQNLCGSVFISQFPTNTTANTATYTHTCPPTPTKPKSKHKCAPATHQLPRWLNQKRSCANSALRSWGLGAPKLGYMLLYVKSLLSEIDTRVVLVSNTLHPIPFLSLYARIITEIPPYLAVTLIGVIVAQIKLSTTNYTNTITPK